MLQLEEFEKEKLGQLKAAEEINIRKRKRRNEKEKLRKERKKAKGLNDR